jgi:hypothetical protein
MGVQEVLSRKSGVIVGDDVLKLFNYAQEHKFAIPAIVSDPASRPSCLAFADLCCPTGRTSPPLLPS